MLREGSQNEKATYRRKPFTEHSGKVKTTGIGAAKWLPRPEVTGGVANKGVKDENFSGVVVIEPFYILIEVGLLYALVKTQRTVHSRFTASKLYLKIKTKNQYLILGSPLPFPDVSGDNSLCLLSQSGVGAELGGKQSGSVG